MCTADDDMARRIFSQQLLKEQNMNLLITRRDVISSSLQEYLPCNRLSEVSRCFTAFLLFT